MLACAKVDAVVSARDRAVPAIVDLTIKANAIGNANTCRRADITFRRDRTVVVDITPERSAFLC